MSHYTSAIKQVESEFDDIYRITATNGLVLDILESEKPKIGSNILYYINPDKDYGPEYTIMNGIIYMINNKSILVSFGGLLGNIPLDESTKKTIKENVLLTYKLE